uniref:MYND-type domain-containing protein n=1 Tax=Plectus sambesii TaxID=2011161 RepID=A0A914XF78_9BILA
MASSSEIGAILLEEWPYAYIVYEEQAASYCHYCLKSKCVDQEKLLQCSQCRFAHYCDSTCQTSAQKDHKEECKCLEQCDGYVPSRKARLIARIIFKRNEKWEPNLNLPKDLQQRRFKDLMNHEQDIIKDRRRFDQYRHICDELKGYFGAEYKVSNGIILDVFGKVTINSFVIFSRNVPVGLGLYVGASILDHSCDPDVFANFNGPRIVVRPLKPGLGQKSLKDLQISYFGTFVPTRERRSLSSFRFYFDCDCSLCKDKLRDLEMFSVKCQQCSGIAFFDESNVANFSATCQSCGSANDVTRAMELMEKLKVALDLFDSNPVADHNTRNAKAMLLDRQASALLSDMNVYSCILSTKLQQIYSNSQMSAEALKHCSKALKTLQRFLHPYQSLRLAQTKYAGMLLVENWTTTEQGIELLSEAENGYKFIGEEEQVQECRSRIDTVNGHSD